MADDETTYYDNGVGLAGQKKLDLAEAEFRKSIKADPRYKEAWQALADTLKAEGKAEQAAAVQKMADAAPGVRSGAAPPLTAEQQTALGGDARVAPTTPPKQADPVPEHPAQPATPNATVTETGVFDDLKFPLLDPKVWTSQVKDNNLVMAVALPPPDFCTITLFASKDLAGDAAAFKKTFDDAVDADQKIKQTVKVEQDSSDQTVPGPAGTELFMRKMYCEAKDFHTCHLYVGIHAQGRFEFIAYQSSGNETFSAHQDDAQKLFANLTVDVKKDAMK